MCTFYQFENISKLCVIWSWRGKRSFWKNWPWIRCWKYNCREFRSISIPTVLWSYSQLWSSLENGRYDPPCDWCNLTNREKSWTSDKTKNFISVASWRCPRTVFHDLSHWEQNSHDSRGFLKMPSQRKYHRFYVTKKILIL